MFGAFSHAGWNMVVKRGADTFLSGVLVAAGCGAIGSVALPFLARPDPGSRPFIEASVAAQVAHIALLTATSRAT